MDVKGINAILDQLEISEVNHGVSDGEKWFGSGELKDIISPIDGLRIGEIITGNSKDYDQIVTAAERAFQVWKNWPAPRRGDVIRQFGLALRHHKESLGKLITIEMGKTLQEGLGEIQEVIDICDMACGESRMLRGIQTHSERPNHRMYEQWHPLGIVGVITAFNFPAAVWGWNLAMALITGNVCIWKPASLTPFTAVACQKILQKVLRLNNAPGAISTLITGSGAEIGNTMCEDRRVPLISYTGSCKAGRLIAKKVAGRMGKTILELGGNNAVIVTQNADLNLAVQSVLFGAIGTAGQRCTSTRRVIIADSIYKKFKKELVNCYNKISIGNPLCGSNLMGPVVNFKAEENLMKAIHQVKVEGGTLIKESKKLSGEEFHSGFYLTPSLAEVSADLPMVKEETFGPLLYLIRYSGDLNEAIKIQNDVPQGLSSAIFTNNIQEAELFLSAQGSDCGIANVNTGTSGAEIGLAFGGEKDTGGGRESGSDAWKSYMRRQTVTVNWGLDPILAQGISFE